MTQKWTQENIPDLTGKTIVVTGANSGLGFECAKTFAQKGATVMLTARNPDKGERAKAEILAAHPAAKLDLMPLDVGNLAAVRNFAAAFKAKYKRLDMLLNNAGVMAIPRQETADGFEMQLGVNHLGHFALTGLLLDVIVSTPGARVHNVSSSVNWMGRINFDDLMGEKKYSRWAAYGQSKLANIFFTYELQHRLTAAGHDTISNTSHPGVVIGQLQHNSAAQSGRTLEGLFYRFGGPLMMAQDVQMGVLPMLYAMTAPEAKGGVFYGPGFMSMRGYPKENRPNKAVYNAAARQRFWKISEELTGVAFDL